MRKYINKMSALEMTTNKKKSFSVQRNLTLAQPKSINKISALEMTANKKKSNAQTYNKDEY